MIYSFDVIHTLGFYSWGIKIDAIPGRINSASILRLLWKGEFRGKCFELRGQGHLSMLVQSIALHNRIITTSNHTIATWNSIQWVLFMNYLELKQKTAEIQL